MIWCNEVKKVKFTKEKTLEVVLSLFRYKWYPYFIIYIIDNPAHNKEVETEWSLRSLQPKPFYDNIK